MAPRKARTTKLEQALARLFYNPRAPGSYGGLKALQHAVDRRLKPKKDKVLQWISGQDTYTLHKPVRRKFQRSRVMVSSMDDQWQADLVDVAKLSRENEGYRYLLTCIDVLSKYAWVVPIKDKTGKTLVQAFSSILEEGRKTNRLQCDKGTEFTNRVFQQYLKEQKIDFFTTQNEETKASIVERFNRTLKSRMWKYFTKNQTQGYLDVLPDLVWSYNRTHHGSIGMTPAEVNRQNQEAVWHRLYSKPLEQKKPRLSVGDRVRISKARKIFKKGYLPNWSQEIFVVHRVQRIAPVMYIIKDQLGEVLKGSFYEEELERVIKKSTDLYQVETVLQERTRRGRKEVLVKWLGYSEQFNQWISKASLRQYKG